MVLFSNDGGALQVHFIKDSSVSHLAADFRVLFRGSCISYQF